MKTRTLFVGNLIYYVNEESLRQLFSEYGRVKSVSLYPEKAFAIVEMGSEKEALKAMEELDNVPFEGKTLYVQFTDSSQRSERRDYVERYV